MPQPPSLAGHWYLLVSTNNFLLIAYANFNNEG